MGSALLGALSLVFTVSLSQLLNRVHMLRIIKFSVLLVFGSTSLCLLFQAASHGTQSETTFGFVVMAACIMAFGLSYTDVESEEEYEQ